MLNWHDQIRLRVQQAHVVVYWHEAPELHWYCEGRQNSSPVLGQMIELRHDFCVLRLPLQTADFEVLQSDLVLVKPGASVAVDVNQSEIRIAQNGEAYQYHLQLEDSTVAEFKSVDGATQIVISGRESSVRAMNGR